MQIWGQYIKIGHSIQEEWSKRDFLNYSQDYEPGGRRDAHVNI
jgi:hypothetical protein